MIVDTIVNLATSIFDRVVPNKSQEQQQQFTLELTKLLSQSDQLKAQLEINQAEAANPNRKYPTWRELLGYILVIAVAWQWIAVPFISFLAVLIGKPLFVDSLPKLDMLDILYLLCGLVGVDASGLIATKVKNRLNK